MENKDDNDDNIYDDAWSTYGAKKFERNYSRLIVIFEAIGFFVLA